MRPKMTSVAGMTLLEIMVVMVILGMIAGLVGVAVLGQLEEAKKREARIQIQNFATPLKLYKLDFGDYPSTSDGLNVLASPPGNKNPYMDSIPRDPWGRDYVYVSPGNNSNVGYEVESYGPNGQDGGEDDIESWNLDKN
jgi:general secretion pathway protein G